MARQDFDPDGRRLPIKIDRASNGEYAPPALTLPQERARRMAHEAASEHARALGLSRRAFMVSAAGAASALAACNAANPDAKGGSFAVPAQGSNRSSCSHVGVSGRR